MEKEVSAPPKRRRKRSKEKPTATKETVNKKATECSPEPERQMKSPDPACSICLGKLENKSFTDSCFHQFCFVCLLEWSKVKTECPLCKQPFKSIIHNVRSYEDYDQYLVQKPEQRRMQTAGGPHRFRYRTTVTLDRILQSDNDLYVLNPTSARTRTTNTRGGSQWGRRRQCATSEFRRRIYLNHLEVTEVRNSRSRQRNVSPEFLSANPACTHRLVPWLNRELNVLLQNQGDHVQFVMELITGLVRRYGISSEEFYQHVYPFIGRHTRHFMHEFENFAKSPYDMISYDQRAYYNPQNQDDQADSDTSEPGSDIMIISPDSDNERILPRIDSPMEERVVTSGNDTTLQTPAMTPFFNILSSDSTATSGWDSPIAGPSGVFYSPPRLFPSSTKSLSLPHTSNARDSLLFTEPFPSTVTDSRNPCSANITTSGHVLEIISSSDSEADSDSSTKSDIIFVSYEKPWVERSPIILVSDGSSTELDVKPQVATEDKPRRKSKKPSHRRNRRGYEHSYPISKSWDSILADMDGYQAESQYIPTMHTENSMTDYSNFDDLSALFSEVTDRFFPSQRSENEYSHKKYQYRDFAKHSKHDHGRSKNRSHSGNVSSSRSRSRSTEDRHPRQSSSSSRSYSRSGRDHRSKHSSHKSKSHSKSRDLHHSSDKKVHNERSTMQSSTRDAANSRSSSVEVINVVDDRHRKRKHKKHKKHKDRKQDRDTDNHDVKHVKSDGDNPHLSDPIITVSDNSNIKRYKKHPTGHKKSSKPSTDVNPSGDNPLQSQSSVGQNLTTAANTGELVDASCTNAIPINTETCAEQFETERHDKIVDVFMNGCIENSQTFTKMNLCENSANDEERPLNSDRSMVPVNLSSALQSSDFVQTTPEKEYCVSTLEKEYCVSKANLDMFAESSDDSNRLVIADEQPQLDNNSDTSETKRMIDFMANFSDKDSESTLVANNILQSFDENTASSAANVAPGDGDKGDNLSTCDSEDGYLNVPLTTDMHDMSPESGDSNDTINYSDMYQFPSFE